MLSRPTSLSALYAFLVLKKDMSWTIRSITPDRPSRLSRQSGRIVRISLDRLVGPSGLAVREVGADH